MSTRIAVLSDSHIGQRISAYPKAVLDELSEFDLIVHAGDHTNLSSLESLRNMGDVRAVRGNMDEIAVTSVLPERLEFEIEDLTIGVTHGWGPPIGLSKKVFGLFASERPRPDLVIFGHTHRPSDESIDGVRMLNPGAISGNLLSKHGSFGILTVDGDLAEWELVKFEV